MLKIRACYIGIVMCVQHVKCSLRTLKLLQSGMIKTNIIYIYVINILYMYVTLYEHTNKSLELFRKVALKYQQPYLFFSEPSKFHQTVYLRYESMDFRFNMLKEISVAIDYNLFTW